MFGFHEIREIKHEERNLYSNRYNPDARIVVNATPSNTDNTKSKQWDPDRRVTINI